MRFDGSVGYMADNGYSMCSTLLVSKTSEDSFIRRPGRVGNLFVLRRLFQQAQQRGLVPVSIALPSPKNGHVGRGIQLLKHKDSEGWESGIGEWRDARGSIMLAQNSRSYVI